MGDFSSININIGMGSPMNKVWLKNYLLVGFETNGNEHILDLEIRVISMTAFQEITHAHPQQNGRQGF